MVNKTKIRTGTDCKKKTKGSCKEETYVHV